jgi:signal transduction histidine kinase
LLEDVTGLARLQAGREERHIAPVDVTSLIQQLCEGIQPLAQQRRLYLRCDGPAGFAADGDAIKIRRIAQNLILNAVKYTQQGGITVRWGDSERNDAKRWELCVMDTGPGFHTSSGRPLADALERTDGSSPPSGSAKEDAAAAAAATTNAASAAHAVSKAEFVRGATPREEAGEGIGLSIVKRLCEMLDATIELRSEPNVGTSVRILFPRHYSS